jgi:hypothetical protein
LRDLKSAILHCNVFQQFLAKFLHLSHGGIGRLGNMWFTGRSFRIASGKKWREWRNIRMWSNLLNVVSIFDFDQMAEQSEEKNQ